MSPSTLVASAVTLALGWVVALGFFFSLDDVPDTYFSDRYLPVAAILILLAAPIGLLVAWGELDLSSFGVVLLGAYVYFELVAGSVVAGLLAAAVSGLVLGAAVGVGRWLTRAPSALLTLGIGFLVQQGVSKLIFEGVDRDGDPAGIDGWGLPVVVAVVVVGLAVAAGVVRERRLSDSAPGMEGPGIEVAIGFALSGMAAGLAGAIAVGLRGSLLRETPPIIEVVTQPTGTGQWAFLTVLVILAIAIGGTVRGGGPAAAIAAALGALAATLLNDALTLNVGWEPQDRQLVVAVVIAGGVVVAHGVHRALGGMDRPRRMVPMPIPPVGAAYPAQPPQPSAPTPSPPPAPSPTPPAPSPTPSQVIAPRLPPPPPAPDPSPPPPEPPEPPPPTPPADPPNPPS